MRKEKTEFKFYNPEIKEAYIEYKNKKTKLSSPKKLHYIFDDCCAREEELGKDVYAFSHQDVIDYYKSLNINNIDDLRNLNSQLSQYKIWCIENNITDDLHNQFKEIKYDTLEKNVVNHAVNELRFFTREQMVKLSDQPSNACDSFIILASFEGLSYKEIAKAKRENFNEQRLEFHMGDVVIPISRKLYDIAIESNETEDIYSLTSDRIWRSAPSEFIIRTKKNASEETKRRTVMVELRVRRLLSIWEYEGVPFCDFIKLNTFRSSGMIDFVKRKAKEYDISPKDYILEDKNFVNDLKESSYRYICRSRRDFYTKYSGFLEL